MSKRRSKRLATKTRVKISKKVREAYRKERKAGRDHNRLLMKIPKSVLMLDSDREKEKRIRELAKQRAELEQQTPKVEVPGHVESLQACIKTADAFVEVVDFRDIQASRCYDSERCVTEAGKPLFVHLSHFDATQGVDLSQLENESMKILTDLSVFADCHQICIFGQPCSGKYTFASEIQKINPTVDITRIKVPAATKTLTAMLRGAVDEKEVDHLVNFERVWPFIDPQTLSDFYMLPSVSSPEEFLDSLAPKSGERTRKRREAAALRFFRDAKNGKFTWFAFPDRFVFKLNTTN